LRMLLELPETHATESQLSDMLRGSFAHFLGDLAKRTSVHDGAKELLKPCVDSVLHLHRRMTPVRAGEDRAAARARWATPIAYALLKPVSVALARAGDLHDAAAWVDTWLMTRDVASAFADTLGDAWQGQQSVLALRVALRFAEHGLHRVDAPPALLTQFQHVLDDSDAQQFLQYNEHEGVLYLNRERLEALVQLFTDVRGPAFKHIHAAEALDAELEDERAAAHDLIAAADAGGYRVERVREFLDARAVDLET